MCSCIPQLCVPKRMQYKTYRVEKLPYHLTLDNSWPAGSVNECLMTHSLHSCFTSWLTISDCIFDCIYSLPCLVVFSFIAAFYFYCYTNKCKCTFGLKIWQNHCSYNIHTSLITCTNVLYLLLPQTCLLPTRSGSWCWMTVLTRLQWSHYTRGSPSLTWLMAVCSRGHFPNTLSGKYVNFITDKAIKEIDELFKQSYKKLKSWNEELPYTTIPQYELCVQHLVEPRCVNDNLSLVVPSSRGVKNCIVNVVLQVKPYDMACSNSCRCGKEPYTIWKDGASRTP